MNEGQKDALNAALAGHSFLLSGLAGVGKSYTTGKIIETLRAKGQHVLVTSSTGIASVQLKEHDARTLHHTFGLLDGRYTLNQLDHLFQHDESYSKLKTNIENANVLIIDEISMVSQKTLNTVEGICR